MTPGDVLDLFALAADAALGAVAALDADARRGRTDVAGQYALDLVADAAVLPLLHEAGVAVLSEESGRSGRPDAPLLVVLDPVDGSTNCSRGLPYWAISLCAMDAAGPYVSLVRNQVTGECTTAVRGAGAWRDGVPLRASGVEHVEHAVVGVAGVPEVVLPWAQFRALGSAALALCDVAAGTLDGYVDAGVWTRPWDYLGGVLACWEAGVPAVDGGGRDLAVAEADARRQVLAAATPRLLEVLRGAVGR